jgi:phytoene dehydrogenase-like protein
MQKYDAIIIGGGHNGLTCGAYLAKAGMKTIVLERRNKIGGAAVSEEIVPGFTFSVFSYAVALLHPKVVSDLSLDAYGLEVYPASDMFGPLPDGRFVQISSDMEKTVENIRQFSEKDAQSYPHFDKYLRESLDLVRNFMLETPPDITSSKFRSRIQSAKFIWKYRKIGDKFYRLLDLITMSADDYLLEWFESTEVRAALAYYASIGTFLGPKSPGSAYVILHHLIGEATTAGFVRGGMGTISEALAASGKAYGMEVWTDVEVAEIVVRGGKTTGVRLTDGRELQADVVASNASAKVTFLKLLDEHTLPEQFVRDVRNLRSFSTAFKINIACEKLPQYTAFEPDTFGYDYPTYVHIGPSIEYLESAYDDAKNGTWSRDPFLTLCAPSHVDPTVAPKGKHVIAVFGGHAPYTLKDASWEDQKEEFTRNVLRVIDTYAPGFSDGIIGMQVLTPVDIEAIIGSPQGHIFHGELMADQFFFARPVPHYADYRTPVKGLYQCGASTHPGGGVGSMPGHNAAREILKDRRGLILRARF